MSSKTLHCVAVYCGASDRVSPLYIDAAFETGRLLARANINLIYGGGTTGLMGALADGALSEKGKVLGVVPACLIHHEKGHPGIGELRVVDSMHARKNSLFDPAQACLVLPGGLGTLDEVVEVFTWRQIDLHEKPIILINTNGYWDPFLALIEHMEKEQFILAEHLHLIQVASTPQHAVQMLDSK